MRTPKAARGRVLGKALARLWCSGPFFLIGLTAYFEGASGIVGDYEALLSLPRH